MTYSRDDVRAMDTEHYAIIAHVENTHWWYAARRTIVRGLVKMLLPQGGHILDIGCGNGGNTACFSHPYTATGLDISPAAIASACTLHPHARFVCANIQEQPEILRTSDMVLLMDTLEHIEDDATFLQSLWNMLKPGCMLLITVPADPALWTEYDKASGHYRRYTPDTLRQLWINTSAVTMLLTSVNTRLAPMIRFIRRLRSGRNSYTDPLQQDMRLPPLWINAMLRRIFEGELHSIEAQLRTGRASVPTSGISLIAILKKP